jgi:hypothetical protein
MALAKEKESNPYSWSRKRRAKSKETPDTFRRMGGEQKRLLRYFLNHGGVQPQRLKAKEIVRAIFNTKEEVKLWACNDDPKEKAVVGRAWAVKRLNALIQRGLIEQEKEGRDRYYYMPADRVESVRKYLARDVFEK